MGHLFFSRLRQYFPPTRNEQNIDVAALQILRAEIVRLEKIVFDFAASIIKVENDITEAQVKWDQESLAMREYESEINRAKEYLSKEFPKLEDHRRPEYIALSKGIKAAVECLVIKQADRKSRQTTSGLSIYLVQYGEKLAKLQEDLERYKNLLNYAQTVLARRERQAVLQATVLLRDTLDHQDDHQQDMHLQL